MSRNIMPSGEVDPQFEYRIVRFGGHKILKLSGEIDAFTAPQFKHSMMSILNDTEKHLILDMHNIKYMDSSAIGVLMFTVKQLIPINGSITLVGCTPTLDHIVRIYHMPSAISLCSSLKEAIIAISA